MKKIHSSIYTPRIQEALYIFGVSETAKRWLIVMPLLLYCQLVPCRQIKDIKFNNFSKGISEYSVVAIIEDHKGFIWLGTESGLNKFDGTNNTIYLKKSGDTCSLSNNRINHLHVALDGSVWISTTQGLNRFDRELNIFHRYYINKGEIDNSKYNIVNRCFEGKDGDMWLATDGGVCILQKEDRHFMSFERYVLHTMNKDIQNHIKESGTTTGVIDTNGNLLVCSLDGRLLEYNKVRGEVREFHFDNGTGQVKHRFEVKRYLRALDGSLWFGTKSSGLFRIIRFENGHVWFDHFLHDPKDENSLLNNAVHALANNKEGEIWVGSENGGLNLFNYHKGLFEAYLPKPGNPNSISGNSVRYLYNDSKERLWIGIFNEGVDWYDKNQVQFTSFRHAVHDDNSLAPKPVTAFIEDSIGNIWIGTDGAGLDYWNRETNVFTHFMHDNGIPESLKSNAVLCLFWATDGNLWTGTYHGGISILERGSRNFRHINTSTGLSENNIFSIVGNKDKIFISTPRKGFDVYDEKTKTLTAHPYNPLDSLGISYNDIMAMHFDRKGQLWLGYYHNTGVDVVHNPHTPPFQVTNYRNIPDDSNSLSSNNITAINEDSKGNIWICTRDGLNMLDTRTNTFTRYGKEEGLPHNTIVGILEDAKKKLWISSLNGLSWLDPETKQIINYTPADGIQGEMFSSRQAYYKSKRGELLFGGTEGFTIFHPDSIRLDTAFPSLYFTSFKIFNKEVPIDKKSRTLKKHIEVTESITLSHEQSVFTLEYVAINYSMAQKTQYAFMLEGFEKKWNYVGAKRTATYTNLDPGKYTFRVMASNNEGGWPEKFKTLEITVTPPFWLTKWFIIAFIVLSLGGAVSFYYYRINRIERQKKLLQQLVDERTKVIESKNSLLLKQSDDLHDTNMLLQERHLLIEGQKEELTAQKRQLEIQKEELIKLNATKDRFFSIIAHDLKNPFNSLFGFSEMLKNRYDTWQDERKKKAINAISDSISQIYDLLLNLLCWSRSQSKTIAFKPEKIFLRKIIESSISLLSHQAEVKKIRLESKNTDENTWIYADDNMISTVIRNLISNALKFTPEEGQIEIDWIEKNGYVQTSIKDSGVGILEKDLNKLFRLDRQYVTSGTNQEKGTGLGLIICKDFIDWHRGEIWVESEEGKGSTFYIKLPKILNEYRKESPLEEGDINS